MIYVCDSPDNSLPITGNRFPNNSRQSVGTGVIVVILFLCFMTVVQYCIPYPYDDDTAYHFSVARLIRVHGILKSFPWTSASWQNANFADKEFVFHLLILPLTTIDFAAGARIVGAVLGGGSCLPSILCCPVSEL